MDIVYTNQNKLSTLLGSTKDKTDSLNKSGICSIKCGDCDDIYYGQTKQKIIERFKEHTACIKCNQAYRSAVAAHALNLGHWNIHLDNVKLVREVSDERKLDAYESYYIQKDNNAMNLDSGNCDSHLLSRFF